MMMAEPRLLRVRTFSLRLGPFGTSGEPEIRSCSFQQVVDHSISSLDKLLGPPHLIPPVSKPPVSLALETVKSLLYVRVNGAPVPSINF